MPFNQRAGFILTFKGGILCSACQSLPVQVSDTGDGQCQLEQVPCRDSLVLDLSLSGRIYSGESPTTESVVDSFITEVVADAGGVDGELESPWRYLSIGRETWDAVPISDVESLWDPNWDLAVRRGLIRLNSGTSGPGCTVGLPWVGRSWEETGDLPEGLMFFEEDFYSDTCALSLDLEGLPGSPRLVLDGWWEDQGCLAMTGLVWLIAPSGGGVLRATVDRYYGQGQSDCDAGLGEGQEAGNYRFRWQWLIEPG